FVATVLLVRTRGQWAGDLGKKIEGNPFATHLRLAHEPRVRRVLAVGAIETFFFFGPFSFLGAYFKVKFGMSLTLAGAILAGFGVGGIFYGLMVRRLLMELGQRGLVLWGVIWCCIFFAATAFIPLWPVLFVCTIGLGFSLYMMYNTLQLKTPEMSSTARGTGVAMYSSAWAIGQAVGAAGMGFSVGLLDYA